MPAPYSDDLRQRVVRAYLDGHGTYAEIAARFEVGVASVDRWVSRFRRTASVSPDPMGGDRNGKFDEDSEEALRYLVSAKPDATREELKDALEAEIELSVSGSAVQRALERLKLTRKKRRSMRQNETKSE
jgi:putative transposase